MGGIAVLCHRKDMATGNHCEVVILSIVFTSNIFLNYFNEWREKFHEWSRTKFRKFHCSFIRHFPELSIYPFSKNMFVAYHRNDNYLAIIIIKTKSEQVTSKSYKQTPNILQLPKLYQDQLMSVQLPLAIIHYCYISFFLSLTTANLKWWCEFSLRNTVPQVWNSSSL